MFEATLRVLTLLPLELSVLEWTFFSVVVDDALGAGFLVTSALVLSDTRDVFFSSEDFELAVEADSDLLFFNDPSDIVGLAFLALATSEPPLSCCFPALPVLLLLCTEPALANKVDLVTEDRTPNSADAPPSDRFLFDEAVPDVSLTLEETVCRSFTGLPSACFEASDGVSIFLVTATEPQTVPPELPF